MKVIGLLCLLVFLVSCAQQAEVIEEQPAVVEQEIIQQEIVSSDLGSAFEMTSEPEFDKKCTVTLSIVTGSSSTENNVTTATYQVGVKHGIEGAYVKFADIGDNAVYGINTKPVSPKETIEYSIDIAQIERELGMELKTATIYPIQNGKACVNQALQHIR